MAAMVHSLLQSQRKSLSIVSFNMHGFNQGLPAIASLIADCTDIIMVQEHWLTPVNLIKFDKLSSDYFTYGSSAMSKTVESKMLVGRPFGGVMLLVNNRLCNCTEFIASADRYVIIRVADCIIINVYLPCKGTVDRQLICQDILDDVWTHRERYPQCKCLIGGDLNVDLQSNDGTATIINSFFADHGLLNCDKSLTRKFTYVNDALNNESVIDYFFYN